MHFDVAIVGLGAMGSAAAWHLTRRGRRVVGFDRFVPPHAMGSSHGQTRIIREAYFEHPQYVPLVQRAYACWARLEEESGDSLFERTGGLMLGRPDSLVVAGARASAEHHGLPFETLSAAEVRARYPALRVGDDTIGLLEPRAGMLFPERCIAAHLRLAATHGATLHTQDTVLAWRAAPDLDSATTAPGTGAAAATATETETETETTTVTTTVTTTETGTAAGTLSPSPLKCQGRGGRGVRSLKNTVIVETTSGRYTADHLVLSAGAWLSSLVPDLRLPLQIERQVVHWFDPGAHAEDFTASRLPIFIYEYGPGLMLYGFPARGEGVKVALHHQGKMTDAEAIGRDVSSGEVDAMRALLAGILPDLNGRWRASSVCLYTNTPDSDFLIDAHPAHPQVLIVSPCSGHGFKFSSAIGEIVADLVIDGGSSFDLTPFRLARFGT